MAIDKDSGPDLLHLLLRLLVSIPTIESQHQLFNPGQLICFFIDYLIDNLTLNLVLALSTLPV